MSTISGHCANRRGDPQAQSEVPEDGTLIVGTSLGNRTESLHADDAPQTILAHERCPTLVLMHRRNIRLTDVCDDMYK